MAQTIDSHRVFKTLMDLRNEYLASDKPHSSFDARAVQEAMLRLLVTVDPDHRIANLLLGSLVGHLRTRPTASKLLVTVDYDYSFACRLGELATDRDSLEALAAAKIAYGIAPQRDEEWLIRKLGRSFSTDEANIVLDRMICNVREGSEHTARGIEDSKPLEIRRVIDFARQHNLDVEDAQDRVQKRYHDLASSL